ncbi:hypothetical protein [Roseimicrobium sp. ORNL1]|uniref:hypothetical protein n=1 Tax=Roseimicrobium sp. ORNL1 TaxID=2711231 RepID=UPI0013E1497B|nr:hypothetical protein [Roseimicrobium sp. ORNL1]QIF01168.1 hypothetical protein G5S37_06420 [Roseimicrobium sp. ORNL1]
MHLSVLRPCAVFSLLLAGLAPVLDAQTPAPQLDKAQLKVQLAARERRANLLRDELRATDARIESTIDQLVDSLKLVRDSKDSRTRVARMKQDSMQRLNNNIALYQRRRADMQEQLRRPTLNLTLEQKQKAIGKIDARIERRVQQILSLSQAMPAHEEHPQFDAVSDGWWGTTFVQNQDFKQNRRLTSHTNTQRRQVMNGMQESIARLERENRTLNASLAQATTEGQRRMLADEVARNEALLKTRRTQLTQAALPSDSSGRPVSLREARDLDTAIRTTADSLRPQVDTLFQQYNALLQEVSRVNTARAALDAAQ